LFLAKSESARVLFEVATLQNHLRIIRVSGEFHRPPKASFLKRAKFKQVNGCGRVATGSKMLAATGGYTLDFHMVLTPKDRCGKRQNPRAISSGKRDLGG